jgi:cellulose synthase/poly-beta-1,6-N-acetylglucosamine synthase-like glycosyltransferase
MILLSFAIALVGVVLLLPTVADLVSLIVAATAGKRTQPGSAALPRLLFLVPAHDEELLIEACVRSLRELQYPAELVRVVVLADNCADRTAELSRAGGAECLEREDQVLRGKPRAIAWALERLPIEEFDTVIIVDADTVVDPLFAESLAASGPLRAKAVQAYHDVANPDETALTRMATVFAAGRYRLGFPLKQRAGLNVPLMGNGMCIGTDVLAEHGWTAFSICEDWELYAILTEKGVPIEFVPGVRLYSQEARSMQQSASQRKRWAAGKITVLSLLAPKIMRNPRIGWHQKLDAVAELTAPGPVVHLGVAVMLCSAAWLLSLPGAMWAGGLVALSVVRQVAFTIGGLLFVAEPLKALAAFMYLPFYAVWRLGIQVAAIALVGDKPWIRTQRHAAPPSG